LDLADSLRKEAIGMGYFEGFDLAGIPAVERGDAFMGKSQETPQLALGFFPLFPRFV
jgi:hypothetical protein